MTIKIPKSNVPILVPCSNQLYTLKLLELFVYEFTVRRSPSLNALRLQRIFDLFNHNGDGFITLEELSQALSRLDLKSTVESYIQPGNAGLNFEDFSSLYKTSDQFQINKMSSPLSLYLSHGCGWGR
ncbi:unnamed protein product [Brassica oleracea]